MADTKAPVQKLQQRAAIVDPNTGLASDYFMRYLFEHGGALTDVQSDKVDKTRQIIAGVGLTGGGDLSSDRTFAIAPTGVTAGVYGDSTHYPVITVNAEGQITAVTLQAGGSSLEVDGNGTPVVTSASKLNFTGSGVTVTTPSTGVATINIPGNSLQVGTFTNITKITTDASITVTNPTTGEAHLVAAGGGSGGARVVAAARVDCTNPAAPVIAYGTNVSGITKTGTGRYTITFTNPIDPTKVAFSGGGQWSTLSAVEIVVLGIDREPGAGLTSTSISVMNYYINPAAIQIYDANNWFSFELTDVTASGGGLVKIGQVVAVGGETNLTISSIPATYEDLILTVNGRRADAGGAEICLRFNGDTGANYSFRRQNIYGNVFSGGTASPEIGSFPNSGGTAGYAGSVTVTIPAYARTVFHKNFICENNTDIDNANNYFYQQSAGTWRNTAAINSVSVFPTASGTWAAGSVITLWGKA